METLKFPVTTNSTNQENKVEFIRVYKNVKLYRSLKFARTCHDMNILVQTAGGD